MFFSDLSEDALDQVLRRLPDFNTLAAAIRASKQLYNIFNAHPNSLKKEIAGNSCGHPDVLPAALRVVRTLTKNAIMRAAASSFAWALPFWSSPAHESPNAVAPCRRRERCADPASPEDEDTDADMAGGMFDMVVR